MQARISLCILVVCNLFYARILATPLEETPPIIFILDGSGSMWGKVGNEFKINIARNVLKDLINGMDHDRQVGMVVYGHRQKGDCSDIAWLAQPGAGTRSLLLESLNDINPTGMTPLSSSAEFVIDFLKAHDQGATVILLTDGIETCDGDLCKTISTAKQEGIDFVMHVVGFDLGDSDKSNLECAARAGQGLFIDASDSPQLAAALNQASELTVEATNATLSIRTTKDGALIDATIAVIPEGTSEPIASIRTYAHQETNPALLHVPAGEYTVHVTPVGMRGVSDIDLELIIPADSLISREVDFSAGKLSILVTSNQELHDAAIKIISAATKKEITGGRSYDSPQSNPKIFDVSPGEYVVRVSSITIDGVGTNITTSPVHVKPGETLPLIYEIPHGTLKIGATHEGELWDCAVNILAPNTNKSFASGRTYTSTTSNPKKFMLSPGSYDVELKPLKLDVPSQTIRIEIESGKTLEKMIVF